MRRTTPNCNNVARDQRALLAALDGLDAPRAIGVLEPLVTDARTARLREVFDARLDSVTILMDAPHDPHNGAAVMRSCDAFGIQRLHIVERTETFLAATSVARGSERWVDVHTYRSSKEAINRLETAGFELIATAPQGELLPEDLARLSGRVCLVLGNERSGITEELTNACGRAVRVPMRGFVESLNVSVTAALLLHFITGPRAGDLEELERQRLFLRALVLTIPRSREILAVHGMSVPELKPRKPDNARGRIEESPTQGESASEGLAVGPTKLHVFGTSS